MHPRDVFLAAGALAGARQVRVLDVKGAAYEPPQPPPPPVEEPDPLAEQLTRVEQSGVAARAALARVSATLEEVGATVQAVAQGQLISVQHLDRIESIVRAPVDVVPVYDKSGKLVGARRVIQGAENVEG